MMYDFFDLAALRNATVKLCKLPYPERVAQATSETLDLLAECDSNNITLPTFVITHPSQVPQALETNSSILLCEIWDLRTSVSVINLQMPCWESLEFRGCKWINARDLSCDQYKDCIISVIFINCLPNTF